jgi:hypothetical protein
MELMASAGKKWPERVQVINQMAGGEYIPAEPKTLQPKRTIDDGLLSRRALDDVGTRPLASRRSI